MAYVGNMGAAGAFGALADFIRNRRSLKQETEDRERARLRDEAQLAALRASTDATIGGTRRADERHIPELNLLNTQAEGAEQEVDFNKEANPLRIRTFEQGLDLGDQRLVQGKQDIDRGAVSLKALQDTQRGIQEGADPFSDQAFAATAALGGVDPNSMITGQRRMQTEKDLATHQGGISRGNMLAGIHAQAGLEGMPPGTQNYVESATKAIQSSAWIPYLRQRETFEEQQRQWAQLEGQSLGRNSQVSAQRQQAQAALQQSYEQAQATAQQIFNRFQQDLSKYHQPGTPEYERAMATLQLALQPPVSPRAGGGPAAGGGIDY